MAVEYFVANDEIQKLAWDLIGKQHPDLAGALNSGELVVVFREKGAKSGGQVVLGASRKATPIINALSGEKYIFIIELAQDGWDKLDHKQKEACLDQFLCACSADYDEKSGTTKFSVVRADVIAYRENIERYGMWFPKDDDGEGEDEASDAVGEMFGGEAN